MELTVTTSAGAASANTLTVSDAAFGGQFNEALVHQVVTAYMAGARAGTHAQKTRAQVSGGGVKPWKQKGSGRARAGSIRSPLWRGGGKIFAATTGDYSQKVNRKMYRGALRSILSELVRQDRLLVVDSFTVDTPKTKGLVQKLGALGLDNVLIVTHALDDNLYLSARNLHNVRVIETGRVDPVSLVAHEKVLFTVDALKRIEETLV